MSKDKKYILTLSARDRNGLAAQAESLLSCLSKKGYVTDDLKDICYTLQIGREVMKNRMAFVIRSMEDLKQMLGQFSRNPEECREIFLGDGEAKTSAVMERWFSDSEDAKKTLRCHIDAGNVEKIAQIWAETGYGDWKYMYEKSGFTPHTVSLPSYHFERNIYWAPAEIKSAEPDSGSDEEALLYEEVWKECDDLQEEEKQNGNVFCMVPEEWYRDIRNYFERKGICGYDYVFVLKGKENRVRDERCYSIRTEKETDFQQFFEEMQEQYPNVNGVLYLWNLEEIPEEREDYYGIIIRLIKGLCASGMPFQKLIFGGGYQTVQERCFSEALVSFEKSLPMILPSITVRTVCMPFSENRIEEYCEILQKEYASKTKESIFYEDGKRKCRRLQEIKEDVQGEKTSGWKQHGVYCITGGMGGIGNILTSWLLREYDASVILLGRKTPEQVQEKLQQFAVYGGEVSYLQADVCEYSQLKNAMKQIQDKYIRINGIIHAAGIEGTTSILKSTLKEFRTVLEPKLTGTENLCRVTENMKLDFLCLFSSSSAMLGDFGNCAYSIGNRFLMMAAEYGKNFIKVINWPLWKDGGMGKGDKETQKFYLKSSGQTMISNEGAIKILENFLKSARRQMLVVTGERKRIESFLQNNQNTQPAKKKKTVRKKVVRKVSAETKRQSFMDGWSVEDCLLYELKNATMEILQIPLEEMEDDGNLADFGYDSITLAEFSTSLSKIFGEKITPDVFFSYPTLSRLCGYLMETYSDKMLSFYQSTEFTGAQGEEIEEEMEESDEMEEQEETFQVSEETTGIHRKEEKIAIVGLSGKFPGALNPDQLWELIRNGKETIKEVPKERKEWWQGDKDPKVCNYKMGLIEGIDQFDPLFFEISPSEAETIDPQQRVLLEEIWKALENAGYGNKLLSEEKIGVFVGAEDGDYKKISPDDVVITSNNASMLSARIAYFLNLTGPNMTMNTACSSGLSAAHQAVLSIQNGECDSAIVGGISLAVTSSAYDSMERAGMLADDRRCYAFDSKACGMVPAEAAAVLIFKKLSKAEKDGNYIYGVVTGSGINYDGRTNGITAPSGQSQKSLITSIYDKYQINPEDIGLILAHGTGTRLGDPIEMNALIGAFAGYTRKCGFCAVESIKSNIGHSLAASGLVSLIVLLKAIENKVIPPQINCDSESEYIKWEDSPFYINKKEKKWETGRRDTRMGAVSAFGMGGTNVHFVIESYENREYTESSKGCYLFAVSAKTEEALENRCQQLLEYLETEGSAHRMKDIQFSLLEGRVHFQYRMAVVAANLQEAIRLLRKRKENVPGVYFNKVKKSFKAQDSIKGLIEELIGKCGKDILMSERRDNLFALAEFYCQGYQIDAEEMYGDRHFIRLALPCYPFDQERCWIESEGQTITVLEKEEQRLSGLLGQNCSNLYELKFKTEIDGNSFYLRDHVIDGNQVFPGVAYLEMACAAAKQALGAKDECVVRISNVGWISPVICNKGEKETVYIVLEEAEDDILNFDIYTLDDEGKEILKSQGTLEVVEEEEYYEDIESLQENAETVFHGEDFYHMYSGMNMEYGKSFHYIQKVYASKESILAYLEMPEEDLEAQKCELVPGMTDGALQSIIGFAILNEEGKNAKSRVPFGMDEIIVYHPCTSRMWAVAVKAESAGKVEKYDVSLCDEMGRVCILIRGYVSVEAEYGNKVQSYVLKRNWVPVLQPDMESCNSDRVDLCAGMEHVPEGTVNIVDISSIEDNIDGTYINFAVNVFRQVKKMISSTYHKGKNLQILIPSDGNGALLGAVDGLLKSAAIENPLFKAKVIEADSTMSADEVRTILDLESADMENCHVIYKENTRYLESYEKIELQEKEEKPWKDGGVYLISGGAGGLGKIYAKEIVSSVEDAVIILLGRKPVKEQTKQFLEELEQENATAEYFSIDVTDKSETYKVIQKIVDKYGKLDGILHCAGMISDDYIINKTEKEFEETLKPKVSGIVSLDQASSDIKLDFFICFSSISGVVGNEGQSDYAAANAFMDRYILSRNEMVKEGKRKGASISFNWPLWKDGGMHVNKENEKMLEESFGTISMPLSSGLGIFYTIWAENRKEKQLFDNVVCMYGKSKIIDKIIESMSDVKEKRMKELENKDDEYELCTFQEEWVLEEQDVVSREGYRIVCFAQDNSFRQTVSSEIEIQGKNIEVIWMIYDDAYEKKSRYEYTLDYEKKEDYIQAFRQIKEDFGTIQSVLYLNPLNNKAFLQDAFGILSILQAMFTVGLNKCSVLLAGGYETPVEKAYAESWIGMDRSVGITSLDVNIGVVLGSLKEIDVSSFISLMIRECFTKKACSVWFDQGIRKTAKICSVEIEESESGKIRENGTYMITGGMGGLGIIFAEYLSRTYHANLVLTGRRSIQDAAERLKELKKSGMNVIYIQADTIDLVQMKHAVEETKRKFGSIHGVIHAAGLGEGKNLVKKDYTEFQSILKPKVQGVITLERALHGENIDFICYFSSSSAVLGDFGSFDYAVANRFMMSYAQYQNSQTVLKGKVFVIEWPLWQDGGMGFKTSASERMYLKASGQKCLEKEDGTLFFDKFLRSGEHNCLLMNGIRGRIEDALGIKKEKRKSSKEKAVQKQTPQKKQPERKENVVEKEVSVKSDENQSGNNEFQNAAIKVLKSVLSKVLKISESRIDEEDSMEEYGLNSIIIMDLTKELEERFGSLSKTLFYEYPTLNGLAGYFAENYKNVFEKEELKSSKSKHIVTHSEKKMHRRAQQKASVSSEIRPEPEKDIAIIGISGTYPKAEDMEQFWENLKTGLDCIEEVPEDRWDNDKYRIQMGEKKTFSRYGGFIKDVDKFDPLFFHISPRDAERTDPQERLFLQYVYYAMEDAGYTRKDMERISNVGVYVGSMYSEYQYYGVEEQMRGNMIAYTGTLSSIANRVSYYLNIHGPSLAVDTMCSSSLTAIYLACEELIKGRCDMMIAGGVNLSIHPNKYVMLAQNNFSSSTGRCVSFGEGGDGYVPSEGVGVVILKPLSKAVEDGDHIYGVIKAIEANHGGKTSGYSVPNPNSQTDVIVRALESAHINPETVNYIEAHGTGTALGDPIEITALTNAYRKYTSKTGICTVGSVKSNIGHCEGAAGVSALSKVLLQLKYHQIVPSIHSEPLNSFIKFEETPFVVPHKLKTWERVTLEEDGRRKEYPLRAGISAFGAGGSNVHMIVEEYMGKEEKQNTSGPYGIILSAQSEVQTKELASKLLDRIQKGFYQEEDMASIAYTLQTGREAMDYRIAFLAENLKELSEKLKCCLGTEGTENGIYAGDMKKENKDLALLFSKEEVNSIMKAWLEKGKLEKILECWTKGMKIDWHVLYEDGKPNRISLPVYPFLKQRCWIDMKHERISADTENYTKSTDSKEIVYAEEKWVPAKVSEILNGNFREKDYILWILNKETDVDAIQSYIQEKQIRGKFTFIRRGQIYDSASDGITVIEFSGSKQLKKGLEKAVENIRMVTHVIYWGADAQEFAEETIPELGYLYKALHLLQVEAVQITVAGRYDNVIKECSIDALNGYAKSARMLMPKTGVAVIAAEQASITMEQFITVSLNSCFTEATVSWKKEDGIWKTNEIKEIHPKEGKSILRKQGVYLITGGLGGIGFVISRWLMKRYHARLLLTGRNLNQKKQERLDKLNQIEGAEAVFCKADVCSEEEMRVAVQMAEDTFGTVNGVIHAAGIEGTSKIFDSTDEQFHRVMAPKVDGTLILNHILKEKPLELICYFSSTSALLGDFGDCAYSTGNRFMMSFARKQNHNMKQKKVYVINWPLWRQGGMGHADNSAMEMYLKSSGLSFLESKDAVQCMELIFQQDRVQHIVFSGKKKRIKAMIEPGSVKREVKKEPVNQLTVKRQVQTENKDIKLLLLEELQQMVSRLLKIPADNIGYDTLLADFGFDSITLSEYADMLNEYYGINVMPDIFYSYSTLIKFRDWMLKEHKQTLKEFYSEKEKDVEEYEEVKEAETELWEKQEEHLEDGIAVVGMSGRFPGAMNIEEFWKNLENGIVTIKPVGEERKLWHKDSKVRKMGWLRGVEEFDPLFFEISPSEAESIDPRQRLLLEESWKALEMAGFGQKLLDREEIGVFVGAEDSTYGMVTNNAGSITANHNAMLAARLAYFLDMKGPNMTINTACSSGLSAVHEACLSIRNRECDAAVAAGVNLFFTPRSYDKMEEAGMISPTQSCYAFDNRADGMVPGEGVAVVVLKRLSQALKDKNPILAVIKGSGINYDGKTNGITAPSAQSQLRLLKSVYKRFHINPEDIGFVMAHGTGTRLGDPIEMNALAEAFREYTDEKQYCAVGSIKSNIGHGLAASGVSSLIAMILSMQNNIIPPQVNCEEESRYINWKESPFYINHEKKEWIDQGNKKRLGTVSSFGMGGTNVHMVVESAASYQQETMAEEGRMCILTLSAKNKNSLVRMETELADYLEKSEGKIPLKDISYTLLEGRKHFLYRKSIAVSNGTEAAKLLRSKGVEGEQKVSRKFIPKKEVIERITQLQKEYSRSTGTKLQEILQELAQYYCTGYSLDGDALFENLPVKRITMPGYSFEHGTYSAEEAMENQPESEDEIITLYLGVKNPPKEEIVLGRFTDGFQSTEEVKKYEEKLKNILNVVLSQPDTEKYGIQIIAPLNDSRYQKAEKMLIKAKGKKKEFRGKMIYVPVDTTQEELIKIADYEKKQSSYENVAYQVQQEKR